VNHLHADYDVIEAMRDSDPDAPLVMLNLLKYRKTAAEGFGVDGMTGREAYTVYGSKFAELGPRFGGEPIWMGRAHETVVGGEDWDIVILVRYPTRAQFIEMFNDPDYKAIAPIRAAALLDSRIVETTQLIPKT